MSSGSKSASAGLAGITAGATRLSLVDGEAGRLSYRGYAVADLVQKGSFEETSYLLLYGKLPSANELKGFRDILEKKRILDPDFLAMLATIPSDSHPMAVLRTAISSLAFFDPEADRLDPKAILEKSLDLIAKTPIIIATWERIRKAETLPVVPKGLSMAEAFLYLLNGEPATAEQAKALDAYLILLADHGFNASTFAARVTVATLSDIYSAVTSGIGALKGSLHGCANQRAMEMFLAIENLENAEPYVMDLLEKKEKIMGFGHRVYKTQDPRADIFRDFSNQICRENEYEKWFRISEAVEQVVTREKGISCNVDFYSATVLFALGIQPDLFTTIFAMSRMVGWCAHVAEQLQDNRLIRPRAEYLGLMDQNYIPIERRN